MLVISIAVSLGSGFLDGGNYSRPLFMDYVATKSEVEVEARFRR